MGGVVHHVDSDDIAVLVKSSIPKKRKTRATTPVEKECDEPSPSSELRVRPNAVKQPLSGDSGVPAWSKWRGKSDNAFQLFLREGGGCKSAWMNTNPAVRESFRSRARRLHAQRGRGERSVADQDIEVEAEEAACREDCASVDD